ncbi:hypothetical protein ACI65C_006050 [Semiaphis heraclei]
MRRQGTARDGGDDGDNGDGGARECVDDGNGGQLLYILFVHSDCTAAYTLRCAQFCRTSVALRPSLSRR